MNATRERYGAADLPALFAGADEIVVAKGKLVRRFDLRKDPPDPEELAEAVLGPTGNLRAPAARVGRRWLIGFHPDAYEELLRGRGR